MTKGRKLEVHGIDQTYAKHQLRVKPNETRYLEYTERKIGIQLVYHFLRKKLYKNRQIEILASTFDPFDIIYPLTLYSKNFKQRSMWPKY